MGTGCKPETIFSLEDEWPAYEHKRLKLEPAGDGRYHLTIDDGHGYRCTVIVLREELQRLAQSAL